MTQHSVRPNPFDYINEVRDPALFAGRREELDQLKENIAQLAAGYVVSPFTAIVGERRIGKTSTALRLKEICTRYGLVALHVTLTEMVVIDPWEFWREVLHSLLMAARHELGAASQAVGFRAAAGEPSSQFTLNEAQVEFFSAYGDRRTQTVPNYLLHDGLRAIVDAVVECDKNGILLIVDEAHLLVQERTLTQQLRSSFRHAGRCGVVFVGEPGLGQLFSDSSQPLFAQGNTIPFENFSDQLDVAECALLPLNEEERQLVSPMTMDYLVKLSQGKPNQIRLICNSIYNRYQKGQQSDLNITIEALDDILDNIAATYTEYDVRQQVESIRTLSSVDLETLYNMTRYPNWTADDIVELDESFRSEGRSQAALARREATLIQKREYFVSHGLMSEDTSRCTLAGDEFLALYLRFWYEIRKHGQLSRSLVLGKGPPTSFGEKIDKALRFFCWEVGRRPSIVVNTFDAHDQLGDEQIAAVTARFEALRKLQSGELINLSENSHFLSKWFGTCELVGKPGSYYLVYFLVRNLQNPRETVGMEVYFDLEDDPLVITDTALLSLRQRAEDCKILVEGWTHFGVQLPSLGGLLEVVGAPGIEDLMASMSTLARWHLASIQHAVGAEEETEASILPGVEEPDSFGDWHNLYAEGRVVEAEESLNRHLSSETERRRFARVYNDRGYVRYGLGKKAEARQDLQLASDYHFSNIALTLSNLAVVYIDDGEYSEAIECIRDAMFITMNAEDVSAGILRLRVPTWQQFRRQEWEQRPANVLEASYVNLGFALLCSGSREESMQALEEGVALMPSSLWLKLALARMHLSQNRFDLALPIYEDMAEQPISDRGLRMEVRAVLSRAPRRRSTERRASR